MSPRMNRALSPWGPAKVRNPEAPNRATPPVLVPTQRKPWRSSSRAVTWLWGRPSLNP